MLNEVLKNIKIYNNKLVSLSPYRKAVPPHKRFQFHCSVGNFPHIRLYIASDFVYNDFNDAKIACERELIRRGVNPFKAQIFIQRRTKANETHA